MSKRPKKPHALSLKSPAGLMAGRIFDKAGKQISVLEWGQLMRDRAYAQIGFDRVGAATLSTVWLGIDHGFGQPRPVIFETALLGPKGTDVVERYCTEPEAKAGHGRHLGDLLKLYGGPATSLLN